MPVSVPRPPRLPVLIALLLLGGLGGQPVQGQSRDTEAALSDTFTTVDSLRTERAFRAGLSRLQELRATHPTHPGVLYRLSFLWADLGKAADEEARSVEYYRKALSAARAAVAADSQSAWAHLAVALAQGRLTLHVSTRERVRRSRAVKTHVDRAIALDSTLAGAYHLRGRWYQGAADLNFVERAVVEVVYGGLPSASYEQAVADFQRALELETRTYHHLELGRTYLKMGRMEAARAQWRATLSAPPVDPFAPEHKADARALLTKHRSG